MLKQKILLNESHEFHKDSLRVLPAQIIKYITLCDEIKHEIFQSPSPEFVQFIAHFL